MAFSFQNRVYTNFNSGPIFSGQTNNRQFRFIIAPEDGSQLDDLKPLVRDMMQGLERELDMKLDWVAVDYLNSGHPQSHIIVRGRDDRGQELVIPCVTISHGLRQRAQDQMTRALGHKSVLEKLSDLQRGVSADRFTVLDRQLAALSWKNIVHPGAAHTSTRSLLTQRAQHLETMR
jgi:type IV secretory pathway VirD2 relaxase